MKTKRKNSFWKTLFCLVLVLLGTASLLREIVFKTEPVLAAQAFSTVPEQQASSQTGEFNTFNLTAEVNKPASPQNFSVKVPVLMYHYIRDGINPNDKEAFFLSVTPANLESQFNFLRENGFQTISLNDLNESLEQHLPLPPKSVILTFDDGYRDFYTTAFPIVQKYNMRVVSFYVAEYTTYPGYMDWQMLREINNSGLVDIESHTLHHLDLTKLPLEEARKEIFESKQVLEQGLGKKVNYFAYPYGGLNPMIINLVQQAGYKLAFSTVYGNKLTSDERYFLRRISVTGSDTLQTFSQKLFAP